MSVSKMHAQPSYCLNLQMENLQLQPRGWDRKPGISGLGQRNTQATELLEAVAVYNIP